MRLLRNLSLSVVVIAFFTTLSFSDTLSTVKERGFLRCGVSEGLPSLSEANSQGVWNGIDIDGCKTVAAAIFGDSSKLKLIHLSAKERITALQTGSIDVLYRNLTWTQKRDAALGINFAGTNYYDGQGFLVYKKLGVNSAKQLDGATVCVKSGTTTELNLADYFRQHNMTYKAVSYDVQAQSDKAFKEGRCDVMINDVTQLAGTILKLKDPNKVKVLPEIISKEPLGPAVREGDDKWFNIVKWTLIATKNAEELGVNSKNVDMMLKSKNPNIQRLLGVTGNAGKNLGLSPKWAYYLIKQVGNYKEIYDRNVGKDSPLKINRGLNRLWKDGGIQYGPPIR